MHSNRLPSSAENLSTTLRTSLAHSAESYNLSFTTAGLLYHQSLTVANLYRVLEDWSAVREAVMADNLLQTRTGRVAHLYYSEIVSRLRLLSSAEFSLLLDGSLHEQHYLLWLAICRRYRFIYQFAVELLHEKYLTFGYRLTQEDYWGFFNAKAEWHRELDRIAPSTRQKQRQIIFKLLRDIGLLSEQNEMMPALLTPRLIRAIGQTAPNDLAIFTISKTDIQRILG